jgi:hypothetical protein
VFFFWSVITASLIGQDDVVQRLITQHYANWAVLDNTQVPNDSFNEYMPIKKVAMRATDDREQRA